MERVITRTITVALLSMTLSACRARSDTRIEATYDPAGRLERLTYDSNSNGTPDMWSHMNGARVVRVEIDKNEDGVIERWEYHDEAGKLQKVGTSSGNDGRVDTWSYAAGDGTTARIERSLERNGSVTRTEFYATGSLVRAEEDADGDGAVDKWEAYTDGILSSVGLDTERAGRPTRRLIYDRHGQVVRVEKEPGR